MRSSLMREGGLGMMKQGIASSSSTMDGERCELLGFVKPCKCAVYQVSCLMSHVQWAVRERFAKDIIKI